MVSEIESVWKIINLSHHPQNQKQIYNVALLLVRGEPEKNNLAAQMTPLTQKSGPVITGGDTSVIENQQELIFLGTLTKTQNNPIIVVWPSSRLKLKFHI